MDFESMLEFVKKTLEDNHAIKPNNPLHQFRDRFMHIKRVYEWAKVIHEDLECDTDLLYTACIFHDVGYPKTKHDHAYNGAQIFKEYALKNNFDKEFIDKVYHMILVHSDKSLIKDPNSSNELILLLEADLLDEEGALGIVWDFMAIGQVKGVTYYDAKEALMHSKHILNQDYMITKKAKEIWKEKQDLVRLFDMELTKDLFEE